MLPLLALQMRVMITLYRGTSEGVVSLQILQHHGPQCSSMLGLHLHADLCLHLGLLVHHQSRHLGLYHLGRGLGLTNLKFHPPGVGEAENTGWENILYQPYRHTRCLY